MNKSLPVFELLIDDESDEIVVDTVSIVDYPAIESPFFAFSKKEKFKLNNERKELIGAALIPDYEIYRRDENDFEYFVKFSKETVRSIAQTYMKRMFQKNMNIQHDSSIPANSFIYQSFIVDTENGIRPPTNLKVPDGSWIVGVKVEDDEIWNKIKSKELTGFSIEGFFNYKQVFNANEDKHIYNLLSKINKILNEHESKKRIK